MKDGSGQKNKIIDSIALGTPSLTSIFGKEGIPAIFFKNLIVYESNEKFIQLINDLFFINKNTYMFDKNIYNKKIKHKWEVFFSSLYK